MMDLWLFSGMKLRTKFDTIIAISIYLFIYIYLNKFYFLTRKNITILVKK